jgi:hypothetical protein
MVTLLTLFTGPGGPWAIAYLGVLEDSRDGCGKTVVGQLGWGWDKRTMGFSQTFQSKVFRTILDAPWYVSNLTLNILAFNDGGLA